MESLLKILKSIKIDEKMRKYFKLNFKIWNFRTKRTRVVFSSIVLVFLVSQIIMPSVGSYAGGPRFNFMDNDYETLLLANATKGETTWRDPVSADYGDIVSFEIYYHNGMEGTVAQNTRIRVNLPSQASTQLVSIANLWADNANLVTDTGTVNVNGLVPALLDYQEGSTIWYPNQGLTPKPDSVHLADGITENGINIGEVIGCWEYAGYVVFQAKVVKTGEPDLAIEKYVKNITKGETEYVKSNTAFPGDELDYKIAITNSGNDSAKNVNLKDILPNKVVYINGTLKRDGQSIGYDIFSSYANIGNLSSSQTTVFKFRAKINSSGFPEGKTPLNNVAKTYADGISVITSSALTCVNVIVEPEPDLTIRKYVKNLTKPDSDYLKVGSAWPKDVLEYKISFSNPGTGTANEVIVKDELPEYVSYVSGSTKLIWGGVGIHPSEIQLPDGITSDGVSIGNLSAGRSGYILFRVKVAACPPAGIHDLINWAKIWANNVSIKKDSAKSILTVTPPPQPLLKIEKDVKNVTAGETKYYDSNKAKPGDILEYRIYFENKGKGTATNVIVKDELPKNVSFISGSAVLKMAGSSYPLSDDVTLNGVSVADLKYGDSGYIYLQVKAKSNLRNGEKIIDTAHIYADCDIHEQDSAETIISKPITIIIEQEQVLGKKLVATGTPTWAIALISALILGMIGFTIKKYKASN